tara:strand:- start:690 stop:923 length:234 start_codon:yes stop_codon:yes gene_type:complete
MKFLIEYLLLNKHIYSTAEKILEVFISEAKNSLDNVKMQEQYTDNQRSGHDWTPQKRYWEGQISGLESALKVIKGGQ